MSTYAQGQSTPIIDIVTYLKTDDEFEGKYSFTVDNTVESVDIELTAKAEGNGKINLGLPVSEFGNMLVKEAFTVLSAGWFLPNGYQFAQQRDYGITGVEFKLWGCEENDNYVDLRNYYLPYGNAEISINDFVDKTDLTIHTADGMSLSVELVTNDPSEKYQVSMLNVPDSENGKEYLVTPFLKLAHSFPFKPVFEK